MQDRPTAHLQDGQTGSTEDDEARREDGERDQWRWLVTRDAVAVQRAGTAILERVPFLRLRVPVLAS